MGRPTTKNQLIEASELNFQKLISLIYSLTETQQLQTFAFDDRDRNVRDVVIHLYEWHRLLLNWVQSNKSGTRKPFLPAPYNWRNYTRLNIEFWEKHQGTSFEDAMALLKKSHSDLMNLISDFSDDELFSNQAFPWTGSTSVGSYCVSSTSSHYDWGIKKIKKHRNGCK